MKNGIQFKASQYTDDHLAGLLKLDFKETQLEALQKSMELVTGIKLTSNLKKNLKQARTKGLKDAGVAGEIQTGQVGTAKYWLYVNIKELVELQLRRAREKSLLAFHTNQKRVWKFTLGSDKARGIHYTHLILENSLKPASAKTSITIAGIYDSEDNLERRCEILKKFNQQIVQLNLTHKIEVAFPKLTTERLAELRSLYSLKNRDFISSQVSAKKQLQKKTIPAPNVSFKFIPPKLFKSKVFVPLTADELISKSQQKVLIEPLGKIECEENEIQDLRQVKLNTKLTLCPLCCRAFLTTESACKHVILCHENYNVEENQKDMFQTPLKSAINVRVTNLSKLLVNELSKTMIRERADEIVTRQEQQNLGGQTENIRDLNLEPNYHVSKFCEVCKSSVENETPPILAEILFENSKVNFPVKFTSCGDGAELVDLAGITKGYCYKCELLLVDSTNGRGRKFSRQPIPVVGETALPTKPKPRTLKKANIYSKRFTNSNTKNITQKRRENFQYEKRPVNQYKQSLQEVVDPEFHTALNIASKRVYNRGREYCKLMDAHLLENMIVLEKQQAAFSSYKNTLQAYQDQKSSFEKSSSELKEKIEKLKKAFEKSKEKVKKMKSGARSEIGKQARLRRDKKKKTLAAAKSKLKNIESKFENSKETKKFKKARSVLLDIPGPKESAFLKLGIKSSKKKGSSLEGRDTYELFKSKKLVDVIFGVEVMGQVQVGNKTVHKLAKEYLKLRYKDLNLTCYQRSFCHHEIDKIEVFDGAAGRLEAQVYSDQIMLMSTHYRDHVIEV